MSIYLFSDFYYSKVCFHKHLYIFPCVLLTQLFFWSLKILASLDFSLQLDTISSPIWRNFHQFKAPYCHFHLLYHTCDHSPGLDIYYPSLRWQWEPDSSFKVLVLTAGLNNFCDQSLIKHCDFPRGSKMMIFC